MEITSKQQLLEQTIRNIESLEAGLKYVDSNVPAVSDIRLDIIALDKANRLVLICVSDRPQTFRTKRGIHILKESIALWDWMVDFKDDFFDGVKHIVGSYPKKIPPRLFLVAPSYAKNLLSLAAELTERVDLGVYTYDPKKFVPGDKAFSKTSFDKLPKVEQKTVKQFNDYQNIELLSLRKVSVAEILTKGLKAYDPVTIEDHLFDLSDEDSNELKKLLKDTQALGLQSYSTKNHIFLKEASGNIPVRITIGPGKTIDIEVHSGKPPKKEHFTVSERKKVVSRLSNK